jgi:hypothetical protein
MIDLKSSKGRVAQFERCPRKIFSWLTDAYVELADVICSIPAGIKRSQAAPSLLELFGNHQATSRKITAFDLRPELG